MLWLYVQAPFAAFRTFAAGWYRPTAAFLTPSAAYGLALNIAGIETRRDDGLSAMTVTQFDLPRARIALGAIPGPHGPFPTVQTLYQQLHNYPVGTSGKERKESTRGNKYNITPVRREFLVDLRACVGLEFPDRPDIESTIRNALSSRGPYPARAYGLPFMGDNAFLLDRLDVLDSPLAAYWYCRLDPDEESGFVASTTRLTCWIDRGQMASTQSYLYAPRPHPPQEPTPDISPVAWTEILPPPRPIEGTKRKKKG